MIKSRWSHSIDWMLVVYPLCIGLLGLGVLSSAGFNPDTQQSKAFATQASYFAVSWVVFFISAFITPNSWKRLSTIVYLGGIGLLLYLLIFGGIRAGGASRWLDFGFFRLQPSEFMKIGVILILAKLFSSEYAPKNGYILKNLLPPLLLMFLPAILIIRQPDLGTGLSILAIGVTMLIVAGLHFSTMFKICLLLLCLAAPAWKFALKPYQQERVLTFLSPERDPLGKGYHSIQSKIAVGSGSIFGKGFRKGTQTQLRFLPEQTTDFVFSVLAEEWGLIGSITVLGLYLFLILHLLSTATKFQDPFSMYVTIGTAALVFWHTIVNIGMVIGVLPVVGITLVIFSYGGSSLVSSMCLLGIVAGLASRRYMFS